MSERTAVTSRFAFVGIVAPALLTVAALAAQALWLGDTPNPLAVHWSGSAPDSSGPQWLYPLLTLLLGFGLSAWLWATALPRLRRGSRGWSFRFLAAMALGLSAFGAVAMSWSVRVQVGIETWQDAPSITAGLFVGLGIGIAAGLAGWFLQPRQAAAYDELPSSHVSVVGGERVAWLGVATAGTAMVAVIILAIVLLAAGAVASWVAGAFAPMWLLLGIAVLLAALAATTLEADVRVDASGVDVRGPAGWPRSRTALAEVTRASAITVEGMGAFGGFGWRRVPGALGVILRSGEALRIERAGRADLVVTVDDAATAAALLTALTNPQSERA